MEKCKQFRLTLDAIKSDTDLSTVNDSCSNRQPLRRFQRTSHSRSRSHQDSKDRLSNHFFVKNICKSVLKQKDSTLNKIVLSVGVPDSKQQGTIIDLTTQKKKHTLPHSSPKKQHHQTIIGKELAYLNMQRNYFQSETSRNHLVTVNRELQQKLERLEGKIQECGKENCFLLEKIRYYQQRENAILGIKSTRTNAQQLKKQIIAKHQTIDAVNCSELLRTQVNALKTENGKLKAALQDSERKISQLEKITNSLANQQEDFMNELVARLKVELSSKEELIQKLQIQLNIFQSKQSKRSDRQQILKHEELAHLKKKYTHVLVKCHQLSQQLANKRKDVKHLRSSSNQDMHYSMSSSLSLSP